MARPAAFPVDGEKTLRYLKNTARNQFPASPWWKNMPGPGPLSHQERVRSGLHRHRCRGHEWCRRRLAGPMRPQDRVALFRRGLQVSPIPDQSYKKASPPTRKVQLEGSKASIAMAMWYRPAITPAPTPPIRRDDRPRACGAKKGRQARLKSAVGEDLVGRPAARVVTDYLKKAGVSTNRSTSFRLHPGGLWLPPPASGQFGPLPDPVHQGRDRVRSGGPPPS